MGDKNLERGGWQRRGGRMYDNSYSGSCRYERGILKR